MDSLMIRQDRKLRRVSLMMIAFMLVTNLMAQEPQNVLFIAIDDLKAIGSLYSEEDADLLRHIYPDDDLRREVVARMTPNLQRLADQSVTFMNAYSASPACNPSRASLMTGIRPHRSGLIANEGGHFFRKWEYQGIRHLENAVTLSGLLKNNGWYTAETGKIFHRVGDFDAADGNRSWTDWTYVQENAGETVRSKWSHPALKWGVQGGPAATVNEHNDLRATDFIARMMENGKAKNDGTTFKLPKDKPFFLACGIYKPHLPFVTTQDMLELFPVEEMNVTRELLEYFVNDIMDIPPLGQRFTGGAIDDHGDPVLGRDRFVEMLKHGLSLDPEDGDLKGWKDMLMHYFACVATADRAVGRLLDGLEKSPFADKTMVILWSDHGYHLGEKLHVSKFTFWDDAARVYFIIKDPRNPQSTGQLCYQPVSLMDIYPTVARMAGLALPDERITGRDLFPLLKEPATGWSAPAHTTFRTPDSHMVRDDRYKLIRYENDNTQVELYDMLYDGEEYYNLVDVPGYAKIVEHMKSMMQTAIDEGEFKGE